MKKKIVVITGPTAVGKSDFAVKYAIENNGEIISIDSRQVYKGLDIGTGKITREEMKGIPHHMLDILDPKEKYNVEQFKIQTQKIIDEIISRGKLPILCGGTGFYIQAIIDNTSYPNAIHDEDLRQQLKNKKSNELYEILNKLDHNFAIKLNNSEKNNSQRLIRFIELAKNFGKVPTVNITESPYEVEWIILTLPNEELKKRIHNRLIKRVENGMIEEVEDLYKNGLPWERMEELGLEYRYISRYLRGMISKEDMLKQLEIEIWHYAKRQIVWLKKHK